MKITINTSVENDSIIFQEIKSEYEEITQIISRTIVDTKEKQLREALIKLGWTPPSQENGENGTDKTRHKAA